MNRNNSQFWKDLKHQLAECKLKDSFIVCIPHDVKIATLRSAVSSAAKRIRPRVSFKIIDLNNGLLKVVRTDNGLLSSIDVSKLPWSEPWANEGIRGTDLTKVIK